MYGVDRGNQHRTVGEGFTNVSRLKIWYKKDFLGISDFSLMQVFTAWNMSVDTFRGRLIVDVLIHNNMVK